ncbi:hypothetical protein ACQP2T_26700 [Nonomuraea sp. CA-143628]|uniref:hypothetical protein n=1 Tax=Nonomuraea sp. CA-143628 TaxID=3239997 RepID=UPI003D8B4A33
MSPIARAAASTFTGPRLTVAWPAYVASRQVTCDGAPLSGLRHHGREPRPITESVAPFWLFWTGTSGLAPLLRPMISASTTHRDSRSCNGVRGYPCDDRVDQPVWRPHIR